MNKTGRFLLALCLVFSTNIIQSFADSGGNSDSFPDSSISNGEYFAEINGLRLWYKISGKGPICIMPTPGWGPGSDIYFESLKELEETFTMVYFDNRGSGRSEKPNMDQYTLSNFISDIDGIRTHLGIEKTWLMGHSKAGVLVLEYALTYPANAKGIILIDASVGHGLPPDEMQKRIMAKKNEPWFQAASSYISRQPENEEDFNTGMRIIMPFYFNSTENYEKNRELLSRGKLSYHAYQGQQYWWDAEDKVSSHLTDIQSSALIIVGMNDFICGPAASEYMHREIPNSKLLVIENAGHFPWLEQPDQFFKGMKDFLPKLGYSKPVF